jgi:hypothetical protein
MQQRWPPRDATAGASVIDDSLGKINEFRIEADAAERAVVVIKETVEVIGHPRQKAAVLQPAIARNSPQ